MSIRIREHAGDDPPGEQHVCRAPRELILFNLARRICQQPKKEDRQDWMHALRLSETPEFMIKLDKEIRRQWPSRTEPFAVPADLLEALKQAQINQTKEQ